MYTRKNSLRLRSWDYSLPGPYFVTICSLDRYPYFTHDEVREKVIGSIRSVGADLSARMNAAVVAEDHIHLLVHLPEDHSVTLARYVSLVKIRITQAGISAHRNIWQRSYYDHVIRDEADQVARMQYIEHHPLKEPGNLSAEWH